MENTFYKDNTSFIGYKIEEKFTRFSSIDKRFLYYFIISNPWNYRVMTIEVGKTTFLTKKEGEYL